MDDDVTLEYALVFSKNIPSVDLFRRLGAKNVEAWARRLGFTTIFADDALALGASCSKLDEMARAFTVFARDGKWLDWVFVRRVLNRDGNTVEDNSVDFDPMLAPGNRLDRMQATAGAEVKQAIEPRTAFLNQQAARQDGRARPDQDGAQRQLHAGKTGTSDFTFDTQFLAFTSRFITVVWAGDNQRVRTLGREDAAYITIVPLWARYMWEVASGYPNQEVRWKVPPRGRSQRPWRPPRAARAPAVPTPWSATTRTTSCATRACCPRPAPEGVPGGPEDKPPGTLNPK